jgi:hypothetical protein
MPTYTKEQRNEALKVLEEECEWSVRMRMVCHRCDQQARISVPPDDVLLDKPSGCAA